LCGDYHIENVIFGEDGKLAGVIDVEGWTTQRVREIYYANALSQRTWRPAAIDLPLARSFVQGYLEEAPLTPDELRQGPEILRWRLVRSLHDLRQYAEDPSNSDALGGILWFDEMASGLPNTGASWEELARLAK
jgi:Ser/Thr protein kinase RdoA (MazF antagonist)